MVKETSYNSAATFDHNFRGAAYVNNFLGVVTYYCYDWKSNLRVLDLKSDAITIALSRYMAYNIHAKLIYDAN